MNLTYIFASIIGIFIFLLLIKKWLPFTICVICLSVSGTWLVLLGLYQFSTFNDSVILSLLMGGSVVGLYYMVEKRVPENLTVFRLPFLMTLFFAAYTTITLTFAVLPFLLILLTWIVLLFIYTYRNKPGVRQTVKNITECCGKW